jgi:hypothetical protein
MAKKAKKPAKKVLATVEPPVEEEAAEEVKESTKEIVEEVKEESKKEKKKIKKEIKEEKKEKGFIYKYKEPKKMMFTVTPAGKYVPINQNKAVVVDKASDLGTSKMKTLVEL